MAIRMKTNLFLTMVSFFFLAQRSFALEISGSKLEYDPKYFRSKREYLWILKAVEFAKKNNEQKSMELLEKAIQFNPSSPAYMIKAFVHEQTAQRMVQEWFQQWTKNLKQPALDDSVLKHHYQMCVRAYQKSIEIFPEDETLHYQLGRSFLQYLNDPARAEEHFLSAFRSSPQKSDYRAALAHTYLLLKRYADSRKEAESMANERETQVQSEAHFILGKIELEQKNFTRALEEFKLSLSLNPGFFFPHHYIARTYESTGQQELAVESHKIFLKLFSPSTLTDLKLAEESRMETERFEQLKRSGKRG